MGFKREASVRCLNPACPVAVNSLYDTLDDNRDEILAGLLELTQAGRVERRVRARGIDATSLDRRMAYERLDKAIATLDRYTADVVRQEYEVTVLEATRWQPAEYAQDPQCPECGSDDHEEA